ncbi:hypothetical protein [Cupriavidus sp. TKC]|nr:hypothetical protein [Cupriavidus sp. TKC]
MIHPDDPTYLRIRRNNRRLKWATAAAIVVLAAANLIPILRG